MNNNLKERSETLNEIMQKEGVVVTYKKVNKNNGYVEGFQVQKPGDNVAMIVYPMPEWENMSDEELAQVLLDVFDNREVTENIDTDFIRDKEYILANVLPRLVSNNNVEYVSNGDYIYDEFLDMFQLYYVTTPQVERGAVTLSEQILSMAGVSKEEIKEAATRNMEREVNILSLASMLGMPENEVPMYVCSNKDMRWGAAVMACPKFIEEVRDILGESFFILPSSVHECLVIPKTEEADFLLEMVKNVNATEVAPSDKLTDALYAVENNAVVKVA